MSISNRFEKVKSRTLKSKVSAVAVVLFTFIQAHLAYIACAAGTIAVATTFGDKSYLIGIANVSESIMKSGKPEDAVKLMQSKIKEYNVWRQNSLNNSMESDKYLPNLYFKLAKAQEAAGMPISEVTASYKKAVFSQFTGTAFAWLFKVLAPQEYAEIAKTFYDAASRAEYCPCYTSLSSFMKQLQYTNQWPAFKAFAEAVFAQSEDPITDAKKFASILKDTNWMKDYEDLCRSQSVLLEYVNEKDYALAKKYVEIEDFKEALNVYERILKTIIHDKHMDTSQLELTICEMLLNSGEYKQAISRTEEFILKFKATKRSLVKEAMLIEGRAYIQLGEIEKAAKEFLTLTIEYPETKQAPEANFFIGYCYMLQNKFDLAKEALNLVVTDSPQSSYANRAKLCLARIESMAK